MEKDRRMRGSSGEAGRKSQMEKFLTCQKYLAGNQIADEGAAVNWVTLQIYAG